MTRGEIASVKVRITLGETFAAEDTEAVLDALEDSMAEIEALQRALQYARLDIP